MRKFLLLVLVSFILSLPVLWGLLDKDFYSYMYVGRGVAIGKDMYVDFADNKGPILYLAYSAIYTLFKNSLEHGLVFALGLIDALALFFWTEAIFSQIKISKKKDVVLSVLILFIYKTFNIGMLISAVYAETLGIMFVGLAIYSWLKKRSLLSGFAFSLAVFSRQSLVVWILFWILDIYKSKKLTAKHVMFGVGASMPMVVFLVYYFSTGGLEYVFNNTVLYNLNYASGFGIFGDQSSWIINAIILLSKETRILILLATIVLVTAFTTKNKSIDKKVKRDYYVLLFISFLSLSGGTLYFHHFSQTLPVIVFVGLFAAVSSKKHVYGPFILVLFLFTLVNYFSYIYVGKAYKERDTAFKNTITENTKHKDNLLLIFYYPKLYFEMNKYSPDRNYHTFLISRSYNPKNDFHRDLHREALDSDDLSKTAFVVYKDRSESSVLADDYLSEFGEDFHLKLQNTVSIGPNTLEFYESVFD
ncbi:hypothetical protein ACFL2C_04220 [Patescibacteria group bacterium]